MKRRTFLAAAAAACSARAGAPGLGTIAYIQEDGLWTRTLPDGAPLRVWSPGGIRLAYCAAPCPSGSEQVGGGDPAKRLLDQRRIFVGNKQITGDNGYRDEKPLWSADGSHILFARIDREERHTLWLTDVEKPSPVQVAGPLGGNESGWFGYYGYIDWRGMVDWYRQ